MKKLKNYYNYNTLVNACIKILNNKGTILYPTDTVWGIGCDATNKNAVEKIFKIKKRSKNKSLIVLVNSFEMLNNYVETIPKLIINYLNHTITPTTVIYNNPINLAKNVIAKDNTIAIRIVGTGFTHELINAFGKPIVSTSANISGQQTPLKFELIEKSILKKVDFIVSLPNFKSTNKTSVIIREVNNKIEFIRK